MIIDTREVTEIGANAITLMIAAGKNHAADIGSPLLVMYNWYNAECMLTSMPEEQLHGDFPLLDAIGMQAIASVAPDGTVTYLPIKE